MEEVRLVNRMPPKDAAAAAPSRVLGALDSDRPGRRRDRLVARPSRPSARRSDHGDAGDDRASGAAASDLDGASSRTRRLARGADHRSEHVPDRRHHRAARHFPFPHLRRRSLRRRHGRHPGAARSRRAHRLRDGGGPLRQRLHRRARLDENARGDRRAAHHGLRSGRGAGAAAHRRARHRRADARPFSARWPRSTARALCAGSTAA